MGWVASEASSEKGVAIRVSEAERNVGQQTEVSVAVVKGARSAKYRAIRIIYQTESLALNVGGRWGWGPAMVLYFGMVFTLVSSLPPNILSYFQTNFNCFSMI